RRHTRSKRDWSSDVCSSDLSSGASRLPLRQSSGESDQAAGARRYWHLAVRATLAPGTLHLGELAIGCATDDQHRAVAGPGDRIAMVSHRRTGDDSDCLKLLLFCVALWQHRGPCKCLISSPAWTRSNW